MSLLKKLTEGIVERDLSKEGATLRAKWEKTGLLEGLADENRKNSMSILLENQAKQLLKEASSMSNGDVEGFAAVAFPIVRRVFGALIANDLVAVQAMTLPSGLIFFLDFSFNTSRLGNEAGESLFGGNVLASQITGGVVLTGDAAEDSFYNLNNGYSSTTGTVAGVTLTHVLSGTFGLGQTPGGKSLDALLRFDADLTSGTTNAAIFTIPVSALPQLNRSNLVAISLTTLSGAQVRRLTRKTNAVGVATVAGDHYSHVAVVITSDLVLPDQLRSDNLSLTVSFPIDDDFVAGRGLGSVKGDPVWDLEAREGIPELNIRIDSVSVTAKTKKLKVKWTPEVGQDLNAYHNIDAEVELTGIMSEQIALELDQEILEDLIKGAQASTMYWSRRPGKFLNKTTGGAISNQANESLLGVDFTGNVSMWYETLMETINDVSAQIHRKTLRGGANFIVCGPEVANILEFTSGFRANVTGDEAKGQAGTLKAGSLSKKWDIWVDPYFPRNVILVGRRGAQFLESGYVYAPYVPLQVTPTIFGTEDFVPRKGVMTRYAKKMVRPDMYGLVIVVDLLG